MESVVALRIGTRFIESAAMVEHGEIQYIIYVWTVVVSIGSHPLFLVILDMADGSKVRILGILPGMCARDAPGAKGERSASCVMAGGAMSQTNFVGKMPNDTHLP
jgi:hypothetical protein